MNVFAVFKNSDMTEGRGHKVLDEVFLNKSDAKSYMNRQPGIMGRKKIWSNEKYGEWEICTLYLNECVADVDVNKRKRIKENALSKLSTKEKEILGLI